MGAIVEGFQGTVHQRVGPCVLLENSFVILHISFDGWGKNTYSQTNAIVRQSRISSCGTIADYSRNVSSLFFPRLGLPSPLLSTEGFKIYLMVNTIQKHTSIEFVQ